MYSLSYDNPLVNAIARQCPKIAEEQKNPTAKRLSGDEILNILCEENCERLDKENGECKEMQKTV